MQRIGIQPYAAVLIWRANQYIRVFSYVRRAMGGHSTILQQTESQVNRKCGKFVHTLMHSQWQFGLHNKMAYLLSHSFSTPVTSHLMFSNRAISIITPNLWNYLLPELRSFFCRGLYLYTTIINHHLHPAPPSNTPRTFHSKLKSHLLKTHTMTHLIIQSLQYELELLLAVVREFPSMKTYITKQFGQSLTAHSKNNLLTKKLTLLSRYTYSE